MLQNPLISVLIYFPFYQQKKKKNPLLENVMDILTIFPDNFQSVTGRVNRNRISKTSLLISGGKESQGMRFVFQRGIGFIMFGQVNE